LRGAKSYSRSEIGCQRGPREATARRFRSGDLDPRGHGRISGLGIEVGLPFRWGRNECVVTTDRNLESPVLNASSASRKQTQLSNSQKMRHRNFKAAGCEKDEMPVNALDEVTDSLYTCVVLERPYFLEPLSLAPSQKNAEAISTSMREIDCDAGSEWPSV
jgi:hypothetical protein